MAPLTLVACASAMPWDQLESCKGGSAGACGALEEECRDPPEHAGTRGVPDREVYCQHYARALAARGRHAEAAEREIANCNDFGSCRWAYNYGLRREAAKDTLTANRLFTGLCDDYEYGAVYCLEYATDHGAVDLTGSIIALRKGCERTGSGHTASVSASGRCCARLAEIFGAGQGVVRDTAVANKYAKLADERGVQTEQVHQSNLDAQHEAAREAAGRAAEAARQDTIDARERRATAKQAAEQPAVPEQKLQEAQQQINKIVRASDAERAATLRAAPQRQQSSAAEASAKPSASSNDSSQSDRCAGYCNCAGPCTKIFNRCDKDCEKITNRDANIQCFHACGVNVHACDEGCGGPRMDCECDAIMRKGK